MNTDEHRVEYILSPPRERTKVRGIRKFYFAHLIYSKNHFRIKSTGPHALETNNETIPSRKKKSLVLYLDSSLAFTSAITPKVSFFFGHY